MCGHFSCVAPGDLPVDLLTEWPAGGEPPRHIPSQYPHKSMIVHIARSQKDSDCPGVEVEVVVPTTEKDRSGRIGVGGRELETDRAGRVDVLSCREEVPWPSSPA